MNMFGNIGGALSPLAVAWLVNTTGSWTPVFVVASVLCLAAALMWFKIDPTQPVVDMHPESEIASAAAR